MFNVHFEDGLKQKRSGKEKPLHNLFVSNLFRGIEKLFISRGIFYLVTRVGGTVLRRLAFDQYYIRGRWDYFDKEDRIEMVKLVVKYAKKGRILDMGCGTGTLASKLSTSDFEYYLGIDVSPEAIARARKNQSEKIHFKTGNIQSYPCKDTFDLIVFEESLYYVPFLRRRLLQDLAQRLRSNGVFIVTVAHPSRFSGMVQMIRRNFQVFEDRCFKNSQRLLLVFH
jgi:SAM-dependent methyltransferase